MNPADLIPFDPDYKVFDFEANKALHLLPWELFWDGGSSSGEDRDTGDELTEGGFIDGGPILGDRFFEKSVVGGNYTDYTYGDSSDEEEEMFPPGPEPGPCRDALFEGSRLAIQRTPFRTPPQVSSPPVPTLHRETGGRIGGGYILQDRFFIYTDELEMADTAPTAAPLEISSAPPAHTHASDLYGSGAGKEMDKICVNI